MMDIRNTITLFWLVLIALSVSSCENKNKAETNDKVKVGSKIDLMEYAVEIIGKDTNNVYIKPGSEDKIVTYTNIYCAPCWRKALLWKENLKYFNEYPQVSFYFYVHSTPKDFEIRNADSKFDFPVFLDIKERFRIVNQLGMDPDKLTFLLNSKNEILIIGLPFTKEIREKYISAISKRGQ